ncbi:MAG: hypothetical protein QW802_04260 [Candidatus Altiarchaeota archaeon]
MRKIEFSFSKHISLVLLVIGLLVVLYSLYKLFHVMSIDTVALLALGVILMVIGVLFKYTEEVEEVEEKLEEQPKIQEMSYWRMQDLEYRLKKIEREKENIAAGTKIKKEISNEEFNKFKAMVDELLEKLREEDIKNFRNSEDFKIYEEVLSNENANDEKKREFVFIVDKLLEKLPIEQVNEFIKDKERYAFYQKILDWAKNE